MASLVNLVPDPATAGIYVPRPAAIINTLWPDYVSGFLVVGDIAYIMSRSRTFAGKDEPFAYNVLTGAPVPMAGVTSANIPTSAPITGAWTPPILAQVAGRVIVCHPGFGTGTIKFGWFDVSGFTESTFGNTYTGGAGGGKVIDGNPTVLGVQPGMTIAGTNIAPGSRVVSTTLYVNKCVGDITTGSNTILNVSVTSGVAPGQVIEGVGIPIGTLVNSIVADTVTMNNNATATATDSAVTFSGATILIDTQMTGRADTVILTIAGGTAQAPLWGAGDTDRNTLASHPVGVAQFNGRAYYALAPLNGVAQGMQFSDSGLPCRINNTLAVQALTPGNGLPITAVYPLMLSAPLLTGGIVQALLAFQGAASIQQITGDPETTDLRMNAVPVQTGTLAPLSLFTCELGTGFVSPDGMRIVKFDGSVTPPMGEGGTGVCSPFINTVEPTRIVAACNRGTIRITNQNGGAAGSPLQEFWYDTKRQVWTGPHTFPANLIQPWRNTFVVTTYNSTTFAALWQSDVVPVPSSGYVENGTVLSWVFQPSPLPDSGDVAMNSLVDMTLGAQLPLGLSITVNASDISGFGLSQAIISSVSNEQSNWGGFLWGTGHWGGGTSLYQQYGVNFDQPLVFKQLNLTVRGQSAHDTRIGNLYMKYQTLGYKLEKAA